MRLLRRLSVLIVVLVLIFVVADIAARIEVEHRLEQRINSHIPGGATVAKDSVAIDAFPFLPSLAISGRIAKITAHATDVGQGSFVLDRVDVTVVGVRVDRSQLAHQKLDVVSINAGTVTADMTQAELERLVGEPVTLDAGSAEVTVDGVGTVSAAISISDGQLHVAAAGLPVSVPIPTLPVLPCLAKVEIIPGHLVASCTFQQIPAALKAALQ